MTLKISNNLKSTLNNDSSSVCEAWICPVCETRNTTTTCETCGFVRHEKRKPAYTPNPQPAHHNNAGMMAWSIVTLFLGLVFGCFSISKTRQANKATCRKQELAFLKSARTLNIIGCIVGVVLIVFIAVYYRTPEILSLNSPGYTAAATPQAIALQDAYSDAEKLLSDGRKGEAAIAFGKLKDYKDAHERSIALWDEIAVRETLSAGPLSSVGLHSNGTVVAVGDNEYGQCNVSEWRNIVAVSAGSGHTVGLRADGTVIAVGTNSQGQCDVSEWKNIVAISVGPHHTVGLKADGTVIAVGYNEQGQCNVSGWENIVAVSAGASHTVGLRADGSVVATKIIEKVNNSLRSDHGQSEVSGWHDIVAVSAGENHTVGLRFDGTVVATDIIIAPEFSNVDYSDCGQDKVSDWTDIVAVSAGNEHTIGLHSDGTVIATEYKGQYYTSEDIADAKNSGLALSEQFFRGPYDVSGWRDIVSISAGYNYALALRADGTVIASEYTGYDFYYNYGQSDRASEWTDIKLPKTTSSSKKPTPTEKPTTPIPERDPYEDYLSEQGLAVAASIPEREIYVLYDYENGDWRHDTIKLLYNGVTETFDFFYFSKYNYPLHRMPMIAADLDGDGDEELAAALNQNGGSDSYIDNLVVFDLNKDGSHSLKVCSPDVFDKLIAERCYGELKSSDQLLVHYDTGSDQCEALLSSSSLCTYQLIYTLNDKNQICFNASALFEEKSSGLYYQVTEILRNLYSSSNTFVSHGGFSGTIYYDGQQFGISELTFDGSMYDPKK